MTRKQIQEACIKNGSLTVKDKYNSIKSWVVTRSTCGHYTLSQFISGKFYAKSHRTGLKHIASVFSTF